MNLRHKPLAGTIVSLTRLRNSRYGNPRYRVTFATHGGTLTLNTAADHALAYEIGNPGYREGSAVLLTIGGRGTVTGIEPSHPRRKDSR